jgi:hypothetical protein
MVGGGWGLSAQQGQDARPSLGLAQAPYRGEAGEEPADADALLGAEEVFARVAESGRRNLGAAWDRLLLWLRNKLRALGLIRGRPG